MTSLPFPLSAPPQADHTDGSESSPARRRSPRAVRTAVSHRTGRAITQRPAGSLSYRRERAHAEIAIGFSWVSVFGCLTLFAYGDPGWVVAGPIWLLSTVMGAVVLIDGMVADARLEQHFRLFWHDWRRVFDIAGEIAVRETICPAALAEGHEPTMEAAA